MSGLRPWGYSRRLPILDVDLAVAFYLHSCRINTLIDHAFGHAPPKVLHTACLLFVGVEIFHLLNVQPRWVIPYKPE